jgi:hypothetical protein
LGLGVGALPEDVLGSAVAGSGLASWSSKLLGLVTVVIITTRIKIRIIN